jgi:hypothetical protein
MVARMNFRNHLLLLLFLDILIMMFVGFGFGTSTTIDPTTTGEEGSFLIDFVLNPTLSGEGGVFKIALTIFIAVSAIGVTSGSNFAGVSGILASTLGTSVRVGTTAVQAGVLMAVIADYWILYSLVAGGATFGMMRIVATIIFLPLVIDGVFAAIDWMRGVST